MVQLLDEIHPGEILREDFMKPMGISARKLSADINVAPNRISDRVNSKRPTTADTTALRLGIPVGMEPRLDPPSIRVRHAQRHTRTSSQNCTAHPRFSVRLNARNSNRLARMGIGYHCGP